MLPGGRLADFRPHVAETADAEKWAAARRNARHARSCVWGSARAIDDFVSGFWRSLSPRPRSLTESTTRRPRLPGRAPLSLSRRRCRLYMDAAGQTRPGRFLGRRRRDAKRGRGLRQGNVPRRPGLPLSERRRSSLRSGPAGPARRQLARAATAPRGPSQRSISLGALYSGPLAEPAAAATRPQCGSGDLRQRRFGDYIGGANGNNGVTGGAGVAPAGAQAFGSGSARSGGPANGGNGRGGGGAGGGVTAANAASSSGPSGAVERLYPSTLRLRLAAPRHMVRAPSTADKVKGARRSTAPPAEPAARAGAAAQSGRQLRTGLCWRYRRQGRRRGRYRHPALTGLFPRAYDLFQGYSPEVIGTEGIAF